MDPVWLSSWRRGWSILTKTSNLDSTGVSAKPRWRERLRRPRFFGWLVQAHQGSETGVLP